MRYHDESHAEGYKRHISNIAYRYGFQVVEEDGIIYHIKDGVKSPVLEEEEHQHSHRWWKSWLKLSEQYGYNVGYEPTNTDQKEQQ